MPADARSSRASERASRASDQMSDVQVAPGAPNTSDWTSGWGRHAQVGNGVLGTIVDSGVLYVSGAFDGAAIATAKTDAQPFPRGSRPHLARIPSSMAVTIAGGTVFACAVELLTGTYYRRSAVTVANATIATIEQRWYVHNKHPVFRCATSFVYSASNPRHIFFIIKPLPSTCIDMRTMRSLLGMRTARRKICW